MEPCIVTEPVEQAKECMTFAEIRAAGRPENCYVEKNTGDYVNAHLTEFLALNPGVCDWTIEGETICAVESPEPSDNCVFAPSPSGGDDSNAIEASIAANPNAEIKGTGTYRFGSTVNVNNSVKIWDMPVQMIGTNEVAWDVSAPNVEYYRSPVDGNNLASACKGWRVRTTADNFVAVTSGLSNIYNKLERDCAGFHINGAENFRIACNDFTDLINEDPTGGNSSTGIMRAVWVNSTVDEPSPSGYVVNNTGRNAQSNNALDDAEFFAVQNYNGSSGTIVVGANRLVDFGKRLTKWQHPDGFVGSNFYHWDTQVGPLGNRVMEDALINIQLDADRVTAVNNRITLDGGGRWQTVVCVHPQSNSSRTYSDIHVDCNDIEVITAPTQNFYGYVVNYRNKNNTAPDGLNALNNNSFTDNVIRGAGINHLFAFDAGYVDAWPGGIDISGNNLISNVLISDFRGSGTTYVP